MGLCNNMPSVSDFSRLDWTVFLEYHVMTELVRTFDHTACADTYLSVHKIYLNKQTLLIMTRSFAYFPI